MTQRASNYRYAQNYNKTCWLIFDRRTNKLFTSTSTRADARKLIVEQDALEALEAKEKAAVEVEIGWMS
jgi:hypothetical protein